MTELESILDKYNFTKRWATPTITFTEIEEQIGFTLPNDYKFFLKNYIKQELFIGPELVILWDIDELLERNKDARILENLPWTIGIGNNPSNEFIAIEFMNDDKFRIVLSPFLDLDKRYHIDIGDSFTDFFVRLDSGKEWFC